MQGPAGTPPSVPPRLPIETGCALSPDTAKDGKPAATAKKTTGREKQTTHLAGFSHPSHARPRHVNDCTTQITGLLWWPGLAGDLSTPRRRGRGPATASFRPIIRRYLLSNNRPLPPHRPRYLRPVLSVCLAVLAPPRLFVLVDGNVTDRHCPLWPRKGFPDLWLTRAAPANVLLLRYLDSDQTTRAALHAGLPSSINALVWDSRLQHVLLRGVCPLCDATLLSVSSC